MIQAGQFRADMNSLQLMDIDNEKLEQEIRDDFFESTKHPTATFSLTRTYASGSQTMVEGNLTIKDVMNPIVFPATVSITDTQVKATAQFAIDADKWNLNHREGKVNRYLEFDLDFTRQPAL
jgi:polyisoprenoid-binding protein YceI